jgi:hypothetical protein
MAGMAPATSREEASSGEARGNAFGGVFARVFGVVRRGDLRRFEQGRCEASTTARLAGRRSAAEAGARTCGELSTAS